MAVDRKAILRRAKAQQDAEIEKVKAIQFPLPDLNGPGGNAFVLLGSANRLMESAGISDVVRQLFHSEATSGEYEMVLATIQKWFTLTVVEKTYVKVPDNFDIKALIQRPDDEDWAQFDPPDDNSPDTGLDEAMDDYEANAERDRQIAEVQDRINREVRAELGLDDDDVVIVQVKKSKKQEAKTDGSD